MQTYPPTYVMIYHNCVGLQMTENIKYISKKMRLNINCYGLMNWCLIGTNKGIDNVTMRFLKKCDYFIYQPLYNVDTNDN